jgi:colicin import membrane protein
MTVAAISSREQALAGGLAFAMHVLFLILLVFGVSWQHKQIDTAAVVDLWRDLPTSAPPAAETPPPPAVKPEPPPPTPKVEAKPPPPAPKVEAKPPPKPEPAPVAKPDIALKEKLEKERKLKEQQAAEEKKKLAVEKARAEALEKQKRAEAEVLKKKQAADAAAKSAANEEQKARDALAAQQAAAAKREIDKYMDGIRTKVRRGLLVPPSVQGNPEADFIVTLLPGGEVLDVRLNKSSGNAAYDAAIEAAIRKGQPYTVPTGDQFQQYFRRFNMAFRPVQ